MTIKSAQIFIARLFLASFLLISSGCDLLGDDGSDPQEASGVLVASGGNFSDQNGFLSTYDPDSGQVDHGDDRAGFLHGLERSDDDLFVLVSTFGPGRIDILDSETLVQTGQISGLASPRSVVRLGSTAWVTGFTFGQPGTLTPVDLTTSSVGTPIEIGVLPESVIESDGTLYVADQGSLGSGSRVYLVDPAAGAISGSIETGCDGPREIFVTDDNELTVVCSGKTVYNEDFTRIIESTPGQIVFVDIQRQEATTRIQLTGQIGSTNGTESAEWSDETGELFVTLASESRVVLVDVPDRRISETIDLPPVDGLIGLSGIAYDAGRQQLYLGRFPTSSAGPFPDFTSSGTVVITDRQGVVQSRFDVGPSPSEIMLLFDE